MMTAFYEVSTPLQVILLIFSQLAVIALTGGIVFLFKRRCDIAKQIGTGVLLLLNIVVYIIMQLDSRITAEGQGLQTELPYGAAFLVTVLSLVFIAGVIQSETRNRKTINQTSIKEAFDILPTGVCFFNEAGLPVLCNLAMHRFGFAVCGKDVQFITDLSACLQDDFALMDGTGIEGNIFVLPDGSAWKLEKRIFVHEDGQRYTQFIASDVTDLHKNRVELTAENTRLRRVQEDLQQLSANMVAITREEEILNTKMRVHDEMGRCLTAAQKYLKNVGSEDIPDSVITAWQRAVAMLKYNNDTPEEDMLSRIRKSCEVMNLAFLQTGALPVQEDAAYLLTCAVRECVTNAVRYADATELYAEFSENEREAKVTVTNNGAVPEGEIIEGGGLSTLRRRVERAGGSMIVQSLPKFKLTVTVPAGKEGV